MEGKTAIVTGSTSGIGLGIVAELAASVVNVVLNGFGDHDEISKIVDDLKQKHNGGLLYCGANVAKPDEIADMVERTRAEFGGVDILVNNAGQHVVLIESFRSRSGTQSSRSICPVPSIPAAFRCPI